MISDADLTEEEMILVNAASESKEAEQTIQKAALVLKMREGIGSLARILKTIENYKGTVTHLETRESKEPGMQFDILVRVDMSRQNLLLLIKSLRQSASLAGVTLLADNSVSIKGKCFLILRLLTCRRALTSLLNSSRLTQLIMRKQ